MRSSASLAIGAAGAMATSKNWRRTWPSRRQASRRPGRPAPCSRHSRRHAGRRGSPADAPSGARPCGRARRHRRRSADRSAPWSVIARIREQLAGFGPAPTRIEHRGGRLVGEQLGGGSQPVEHPLVYFRAPPPRAPRPPCGSRPASSPPEPGHCRMVRSRGRLQCANHRLDGPWLRVRSDPYPDPCDLEFDAVRARAAATCTARRDRSCRRFGLRRLHHRRHKHRRRGQG